MKLETLEEKRDRLKKELLNVEDEIKYQSKQEILKKTQELKDNIISLINEYNNFQEENEFTFKITAFVADYSFYDVQYLVDPFNHEGDSNRGIWYSSSADC